MTFLGNVDNRTRNMFNFSDVLDFDLCFLKDQNQEALFIIVLMIKHPNMSCNLTCLLLIYALYHWYLLTCAVIFKSQQPPLQTRLRFLSWIQAP